MFTPIIVKNCVNHIGGNNQFPEEVFRIANCPMLPSWSTVMWCSNSLFESGKSLLWWTPRLSWREIAAWIDAVTKRALAAALAFSTKLVLAINESWSTCIFSRDFIFSY